MRKSRRPLGQVRRALLVASVFSASISLLMLAVPVFALQLLEAAVPAGSPELIAVLAGLTMLALLVAAVLDYCRHLMLLRAGLWVDHTLGAAVLESGLARGAAAGTLEARAAAVKSLSGALASGAVVPALEVPCALVACGLVYLLHPMLAAACAVAILIHLACLQLAGRIAEPIRNDATPWHGEIIREPNHLSAGGLAAGAARRWELSNRRSVAHRYDVGRQHGAANAGAALLRAAGIVGVMAAGGYLVVADSLAPAAAVAAALAAAHTLGVIERAVAAGGRVAAARRAWRTLAALDLSGLAVAEPADGRIVLDAASFCHPGQRQPALSGVTLTIAPGEAIGIIGPRGSGKSTLAAAIAGLLEPVDGRADIGGVPIAVCQRSARPIGYASDEPRLLAGSVLDNITGFDRNAETAAVRAAVMAGAHDLIAALPQGYETDVGRDGFGLPMRVRRAVALSRALYGNPRVVVLDEPELGLDDAGLASLASTLDGLRRSGISLVVATAEPRLLHATDRVVVMARGTIATVLPSRQIAGLPAPHVAAYPHRQVA